MLCYNSLVPSVPWAYVIRAKSLAGEEARLASSLQFRLFLGKQSCCLEYNNFFFQKHGYMVTLLCIVEVQDILPYGNIGTYLRKIDSFTIHIILL